MGRGRTGGGSDEEERVTGGKRAAHLTDAGQAQQVLSERPGLGSRQGRARAEEGEGEKEARRGCI
jgi:hypothetical protein